MKICACCEKIKHLSEFYKHSGNTDKRQSYCKACKREYRNVRQLKPWGTPEKPPPIMPSIPFEFKQFLFFLTLPENKQKVYNEYRKGLSIREKILLVQMNRDNGSEWKEAA